MRMLSKVLLVFVQGVLVLSANFANASTFGESCSALPVFDDTEYLVDNTAYGFLQKNIDMKTYVEDACTQGASEFTFCIKNSSGSSDVCTAKTMKIGDKATLGSMNSNPAIGANPILRDIDLEVKAIDSSICLVMPTSRGILPLMCRDGDTKELISQDEPEICKTLGQSCFDGKSKSQSLLSFSGMTVHCLRNALDKVFYSGDECPSFEDDIIYSALQPFPVFQDAMKRAVTAALILYVMFYGFKVVMNGEYAQLDKIAMFIMKIVLVSYFAVGFGQTSFDSGKEISKNGMTDYALPALLQMTSDFTEIVFMSGGSQGLCDFDSSKYDSGYEFYKIWDAIDCRIGYYLGLQALYNGGTVLRSLSGVAADKGTHGEAIDLDDIANGGIHELSIEGGLTFFPVMFGMFMAGQIIVVLLGLAFVVFFVSVVLYFITAYLVCMITLYVMTYISPIFITMALFNRTKGYFDSWLRIVAACVIQPAVIGGFIAMLLTVYDSAIYETCEFQRYDYKLNDISFSTFELREPVVDVEKCHGSLGYKLMKYYLGHGWEKKTVMLFEVNKINDYLNMTLSLVYVMMYIFIFYFFIKSVNQFVSALSGGPSLASVTASPTAIVDKAAGLVKAGIAAAKAAVAVGKTVAKAKSGDTKGAMEDGKEALKEVKEVKKNVKEDTTSNKGSSGDNISLDGTQKDGSDAMDRVSTKVTDVASKVGGGGDKAGGGGKGGGGGGESMGGAG